MANNVSIAKVKKGNTVILCAFTGMKIGVKDVTAADKNTVTIATDKGELVFDRKTAKQIEPEPKAARFANFIIEDDGSYVPPVRKKKEKPAKKAKSASEEAEEAAEEVEEAPAPKKAKKTTPKKSPKKQPEPVEDDDDEDDDFDDDDFEEVE